MSANGHNRPGTLPPSKPHSTISGIGSADSTLPSITARVWIPSSKSVQYLFVKKVFVNA